MGVRFNRHGAKKQLFTGSAGMLHLWCNYAAPLVFLCSFVHKGIVLPQYSYWITPVLLLDTPVLLIGLLQYFDWITPVLLLDYSSTSIRIYKSTGSCFPANLHFLINSSTHFLVYLYLVYSSTSDNIYYRKMNIDKPCHNSFCEPAATERRSKKTHGFHRCTRSL